MIRTALKLAVAAAVVSGLSACDTSGNGTDATPDSPGAVTVPEVATEATTGLADGVSEKPMPTTQIEGVVMVDDEVVRSIFNRDEDSEPVNVDQLELNNPAF